MTPLRLPDGCFAPLGLDVGLREDKQRTERTPLRILLADDSPAVRRIVKRLLEGEGFEVVGAAADGREALRLAGEVSPDVVVLDWSMPEMDGLEVTRELHRLYPHIQVVLLTVRAEEHHVQMAFSAGVRGYVVKARAVEDLSRAIEVVSAGGTFSSPGVRPNPGGATFVGDSPS